MFTILKIQKSGQNFLLSNLMHFSIHNNIFTAGHFVPLWQFTAFRNDVIRPTVWFMVNRCFHGKFKMANHALVRNPHPEADA